MDEKPIQRNIQFPPSLYEDLKIIAKERNLSFAAIVREACIQYLDVKTPGLCPQCHTQNNPDAQFCQKCGSALTEEAKKQIIEAEKLIEKTGIIEEIRNIVRQELGIGGSDRKELGVENGSDDKTK